jgi:hypothetical protein
MTANGALRYPPIKTPCGRTRNSSQGREFPLSRRAHLGEFLLWCPTCDRSAFSVSMGNYTNSPLPILVCFLADGEERTVTLAFYLGRHFLRQSIFEMRMRFRGGCFEDRGQKKLRLGEEMMVRFLWD